MEPTFAIDQNTIVIAVVVIAVLYIIFKIASKILKFVGIAIVVGLGIFFWNGGTVDDLKEEAVQALFKEKDINEMLNTYCTGGDSESFKCDCIVRPVYDDLTSRLSAEDIAALSTNEEERMNQIRLSLKNKGSEIRSCIVKEKGGEYWDKVKGVVETAGEQLKKNGGE